MFPADFYISARGQLLRLTRTLTPDLIKSNAHANKLPDFICLLWAMLGVVNDALDMMWTETIVP
jgi:hypothetical protein